MSDRRPLMPKATAVWLVENTSLSFEQIAEFCGLHLLEVKGIADGDVAQGIKGMDPVTSGQLTREEIEEAEARPRATSCSSPSRRSSCRRDAQAARARATRRSRAATTGPNAVLWLLRNHPELKDSQIMRLVGTTKPTIAQIRDRTHWNSPNLDAAGPGDARPLLADRSRRRGEEGRAPPRARAQGHAQGAEKAGTLLPTEETTAAAEPSAQAEIVQPKAAEEAREETRQEEQARVFAKLKELSAANAPTTKASGRAIGRGRANSLSQDARPEHAAQPRGAMCGAIPAPTAPGSAASARSTVRSFAA